MDVQGPSRVSRTPSVTKTILVGTMVALAAALGVFVASRPSDQVAALVLALFTALFALRVAGQVLVALCAPAWLPPMEDWKYVPYRILLPVQLVLLGIMGAICLAVLNGWEVRGARLLLPAAFLYWGAMAVRYALRMRRPGERWFGGAIPIVFHCVLAGFVVVLGVSLAPG
jgi:hypothetical protein